MPFLLNGVYTEVEQTKRTAELLYVHNNQAVYSCAHGLTA